MDKYLTEQDRIDKIEEWLKWWSSDTRDGWDGIWKGFKALSEETGISVSKCKQICRKLRKDNDAELRTLVDEDGRLAGSGYFIYEFKQKDI